MKRPIARSAIALAFALLIAAGSLPAQTPEERFQQLEQGWMDALSAQDTAALERVLAAEFTIIGAGSTAAEPPGSRAVWLANAMRHRWPRHAVRVEGYLTLSGGGFPETRFALSQTAGGAMTGAGFGVGA